MPSLIRAANQFETDFVHIRIFWAKSLVRPSDIVVIRLGNAPWPNVMSYHVAQYRCSLSPCQLASPPPDWRAILQWYLETAYHYHCILCMTDEALPLMMSR